MYDVGQVYSMSANCGIIKFVGGPYDGRSGLYDHNQYDQIAFSHAEERATHSYEPVNRGRSWEYKYKGPYHWDREFCDWFWWCVMHKEASV